MSQENGGCINIVGRHHFYFLYLFTEAVKFISELRKNLSKALELTRAYERMFCLTEVFIEAVPTVLIQVVILNRQNILYHPGSTGLEAIKFFFCFFSSIVSACIGLAKALRHGICRTMADSNAIDLLTGRFLMACLSCGLVFVSKGFMVAIIAQQASDNDVDKIGIEAAVAACFGLFIPQLLLALWSTVGLKKSSLKIITQDPSIILLPAFTFFTFAKMNTLRGVRDVRVKFSPLYTMINIILSTVYGLTIKAVLTKKGMNKSNFFFGLAYDSFIVCAPLFSFGIVSTAIFIYYDLVFCCCCDCCLLPPGQISVYDPDNPEKELVWRHGRVEEVSQERKNGDWERDDNIMEDEDNNHFQIIQINDDLEMVVAVDGGRMVNEN